MGLFSKLFAKPPEPEKSFTDPILGPMTWSDEAEAWSGHHNSFDFLIDYTQKKLPSPAILAYAREILNDPSWLQATLLEAKTKFKHDIPAKHRALHNDEIDNLTWDQISFGFYRKPVNGENRRIFATLNGGHDYRCWRIEYLYRTCSGLGFDT